MTVFTGLFPRSTGVTNNINNVSVLFKRPSVTASQHAQYQDPETEAAEWNWAIIHFTIDTCAFPTVTGNIA